MRSTDQKLAHLDRSNAPRWVGALADTMIAARGTPAGVKRVFDRSSTPMLLVDCDRRYADANGPARLAFRQSLEDLRQLRIDDLTPEYFLPQMEQAWTKLTTAGCVAGVYDVASPAGTSFEVVYFAMTDALPELSLIAFAPANWPDDELLSDLVQADRQEVGALTRRELEILQLAAEGRSGPMIAEELVVSTTTVKTHFDHIYRKLGVRDRAAAVAKAMRSGLII